MLKKVMLVTAVAMLGCVAVVLVGLSMAAEIIEIDTELKHCPN